MPRHYAERSVRDMTPVEAAWVAGLLEGEGSFVLTLSHGVRKGRVSMQLTDLDVLQRLVRITGAGRLHQVTRNNRPDRKPCWGWAINARADMRALLPQVRPFLGERRCHQLDVVAAVCLANDPAMEAAS